MVTSAQQAEFHTLLDWNLLRSPEGAELQVAKLLYQNNNFYQIIPYREANDGMGHKIGVQTSLPQAYLSAYGLRHKATHGTTAVITEPTAFAVSPWKALYDLTKLNGASVELMKAASDHSEALTQLIEGQMLYGNHSVNELDPQGFMIRHSSLSGEIGKYTIDAGGAADNAPNLTSIILAGVGPGALYGVFPKGSATAGIESLDLGLQKDQNATGTIYVYEGRYSQQFGLAEEDHRFSVRIANININGLVSGTGGNLGLPFLMRDALARVQSRMRLKIGPMGVNHYWVMSATVFRYLLHQTQTGVSQGAGITWENFDNGFVQKMQMPMFGGVPIVFSDQFIPEAAVTA